eukprot:COSAG04_NODE_651_length_11559_cov_6.052880_7_plen_387_part_00
MSAQQHIDSVLDTAGKLDFRRALAQLLSSLGLDDAQACSDSVAEVCSEALYRQMLGRVRCILAEDVVLRTSANPHGLLPVSQRTHANRKSTFRAICAAVTGGQPELPCNKGTAPWLTQVDRVVDAIGEHYRPYGSWSQACTMFLQCLRAMQHDELAEQYHRRFDELRPVREQHAAQPKTVLTDQQAAEIRKAVAQAADDALELGDEATQQAALAMLLLWGTSSDWQPQRRDCLTYRFLSPTSDASKENLYNPADGTLTVVSANKVKLRQPVVLDVGRTNPKLAALLNKIAEAPPCAHLLFARRPDETCVPISPSSLNYRLEAAFKTYGLDGPLAKLASSCNAARHYAVACGRKRRRLTEVEREAEATAARERLSSVRMAETRYAQV